MDWIPLTDQEEINKFMSAFGRFHDACLKELYLWTDHYVNNDFAMNVSNKLDNRIRVLFQRQWNDPSAVELLFEEVVKLCISPSSENYDSIIFGASLYFENGICYWADDSNWRHDKQVSYEVNWIAARKVSWREVSNWMGKQQRYGIIESE
ncbi:hypothetical protein [Paenibacillus mesotrionivorans]|uniref:Uncharacterized protein n=1 Tax=Paenibacillus mesotrionivorans TaxID=3160968 RepID=A0ACC7NZ96_9BACL